MNILIIGAGATGSYLYSTLASAEHSISMLVRPSRLALLNNLNELVFSDYLGHNQRLPIPNLVTDIEESYDIIFVTVKCHQIPELIEPLSTVATKDSLVVLLQNGLGSEKPLVNALPDRRFIKGVTQFNVLSLGQGLFHKGTEGHFIVEQHPNIEKLVSSTSTNTTKIVSCDDIKALQHGKLLLNLNNALNAILDLPIKQELEDREMRLLLARAMEEWLAINRAMQQPLEQLTSVKPSWVPKILCLPNWLFKRVAQKMLAIDPKARSSMWEDIQAGRKTEIEFINGAVVALGMDVAISTPVNQLVVDLIGQLETGNQVDKAYIRSKLYTVN